MKNELLWIFLFQILLPLLTFLINILHCMPQRNGVIKRKLWYSKLHGISGYILIGWLTLIGLSCVLNFLTSIDKELYQFIFGGFFIYLNVYSIVHRRYEVAQMKLS